MKKDDLVMAVQQEIGTKKQAEKIVSLILDTITDALIKKESVTLIGFGTFMVSERAARVGRNIITGEKINIPAKYVPKFVPGKKLKDAVNQQ